MKRLFISTLTVLMSMGVLSAAASAAQVSPGSATADLNGDGSVTLHEVVTYNRDFRDKRWVVGAIASDLWMRSP